MSKKVRVRTEVYCTVQVEGIHRWETCPFEEVFYLRDPHRHVFHIKAYKQVNHDDRDVEFIMLKHQIENHLYTEYGSDLTNVCEFGNMSCEMIAKELIRLFDLSRCEVSEDNENGAVVTVIEEVK